MAERVAVLGTGIMGAPMARNPLKAGFQVGVWNRTPDKARVLAAEGADLAETTAGAVGEAAGGGAGGGGGGARGAGAGPGAGGEPPRAGGARGGGGGARRGPPRR